MAFLGVAHAMIVNTGSFRPRIAVSLAARAKKVTGVFTVGFHPMAKTGRYGMFLGKETYLCEKE
jgi:hypothetical protein